MIFKIVVIFIIIDDCKMVNYRYVWTTLIRGVLIDRFTEESHWLTSVEEMTTEEIFRFHLNRMRKQYICQMIEQSPHLYEMYDILYDYEGDLSDIDKLKSHLNEKYHIEYFVKVAEIVFPEGNYCISKVEKAPECYGCFHNLDGTKDHMDDLTGCLRR